MRFYTQVAGSIALSVPRLCESMVGALLGRGRGLRTTQNFSRQFLERHMNLQIRKIQHSPLDESKKYLFLHLNQRSLLDAILSCAVLPSVVSKPVSVFANVEFLLLPFYGWALWVAGAQCVVRQHPGWAKGSLNKLISRMQSEDFHWMMSVEGRRSENGKLSPYRKGAAIASIAANVEIVPYITRGTWECVHYWGAPDQPKFLTLELLPPISPTGITDKDVLMEKICDSAEKYLGQRPVIYTSKK